MPNSVKKHPCTLCATSQSRNSADSRRFPLLSKVIAIPPLHCLLQHTIPALLVWDLNRQFCSRIKVSVPHKTASEEWSAEVLASVWLLTRPDALFHTACVTRCGTHDNQGQLRCVSTPTDLDTGRNTTLHVSSVKLALCLQDQLSHSKSERRADLVMKTT